MKKIMLLILLTGSIFTLSAQEKPEFLIGFEFGSNILDSEIKDTWFIRQDANNYSNYNLPQGSANNMTSHQYIGIKPELSLYNGKLSLLSGIRLNLLYSELYGAYGFNDQDYFFLRYEKDDNKMKFARIKSASENTAYLTIPLEARYFFLQTSWLGLFVKAGTEAGFKISNKNQMDFVNTKMEQKEEAIWNKVSEEINPFYASIYGAIGCRVHLTKRIDLNFEATIPHSLTANNSSIVNSTPISGVQMSIQIPLEKRDAFNVLFK